MKNILLTTLVIFGLTTISMAQVPAYVPTNGLVGWWPFTGNANDLSGNGNNGTNNGSTLTTDRFANLNSAYNFDGLSNYIQAISSGPTGTGISVSYWFQSTQTVSPRTAIAWGGNGWGTMFEIIHNYGMPSCLGAAIHGGGTHFNPGATSNPQNGNWHHYIVILPSNANAYNQTIFYLDGIQVIGSCLWNNYGAPSPNIGNINPIKFGKDWGGTGSIFFDGKLDDIGIWNRVLTACEINNLYTSSGSVTTTTTAASICIGASTTITASGATTYAWMPGNLTGATITVSPTSTTTYTVTGTSNGCINTATRIITVNPLPVVTATSTAAAVCVGGSVTLTGGGATSYTWSGGVTNAVSFIPTATTTYTVTGTSAAGCINTATITVTVNPLPVVTATSTAAAVCAGASVTLTGGGALTYVWSGGVTNAVSFIPTATTTYTVTGTNINGCVNTATITVTVNPLPVVTTTTTAPSICIGASTTITANGATTYAWMPGNLTGATITVSPTATTTYTVTGTNANGCVNTATRIITVNPLPIVTATSTAASVCTGSNVTLTGGGATSYTWSGGVTNAVSFIPTATTTYTVTGTNINGCVNTATITVTVNQLPVVTATSTAAAICVGGSVTLTGGGATSYTWSGGVTNAVSFIPTTTTTYTVTGTNINGCVNTATITVIVNPLPVVTATSTAPSICLGGSVTLAANGASNYNWMPGNISGFLVSVSPTATTTYTVTGTNINGCVNTATITVTVNPLPVVTATSTSASVCTGSNVTLTGGGATSYTWSGGVTNAVSFIPTATTTYTVTGTNINGCVNTATITVTVNPLPVVTATSSSATVCAGTSVTLTGSGATTYTWDNNVIDAVSFVPTATTTYMVTGTDSNACVNTATITVTVNPLPIVTATSTAAAVCAGGSVTLTGGGAATYTWDNNVMDTVSFVPMATTTYMVIGTDANGCSDTAMTTVSVNPLPVITATSTTAVVCAGGSVTLTGGGASTYTWDNNVMDAVSFVPTATTTYMVTGTDANGCVNTAMTTVTVNPLPIVTATSSASSVCTGGSVTLTGGGAATYTWDNNVMDAVSFVPTATTTYMVTGTDANGCVNTATTTVTLSGLLIISLGPDIIQCSGTALLDAGNMGSTFLWNNASTTQTITVSASGTYIVVVTDVNGCNGSDTAVVTINSNPSVSAAASSSVVCVDDADVSLIGTPTGGVWSGPGVNGLLLNPTAAGVGLQSAVYSYTDVNGCEGMDSVNVQVNACVGLVENILANGVSVYPNPNSGTFIVSANVNVDELTLEMLDLQGRVVFSSIENNIQSGFTKQINMENVANGVYMLRITTNKEQVSLKVAVQK